MITLGNYLVFAGIAVLAALVIGSWVNTAYWMKRIWNDFHTMHPLVDGARAGHPRPSPKSKYEEYMYVVTQIRESIKDYGD